MLARAPLEPARPPEAVPLTDYGYLAIVGHFFLIVQAATDAAGGIILLTGVAMVFYELFHRRLAASIGPRILMPRLAVHAGLGAIAVGFALGVVAVQVAGLAVALAGWGVVLAHMIAGRRNLELGVLLAYAELWPLALLSCAMATWF